MKKNAILVINCGSSSLKFSLINPECGEIIISGIAERLSSPSACITTKYQGDKGQQPLSPPYAHKAAISELVGILSKHQLVEQVCAIGHRVVHGGEDYSQPTLITDDVKQTIVKLSKLAPLHNPANLIGIEACQKVFSQLPQMAIFDTAFHQTMPDTAYIYGIPYSMYQKHSIRKYGFHGTSHYFVATQAAKMLNRPLSDCNIITAHLGNGCSVTAVSQGKSVDSSMGFTPLEGVMMGSRSGSIDPGIIFHLIDQLGYSADEVNKLLNKESGLLGVSGLSNDCRTLEQAMLEEKHPQAKLALDVFSYQIAKSIASLSASLNQLDGIVFTGGIGENSSYVREQVTSYLSLLNIKIDTEKNASTRFGQSGNIGQENSRPCWVIPTNEEWVIAQQSYQLLNKE